ncbi:undecaprenyldiphospho-muramoylpentapeptide beta-N-acetylglucosaminyltransferase [Marinomonas sp. M1K-6]|uniref:UDP-N-acetylglucosamine--N-acetylmuramyl-(pentapeptide) pyrophosphoryl-undecaprenol N-acetylglucosamine transferase n=1 Tax=Marinomonas profundi TaxID=2726122 RepID=A0A847RBV6_9GAMM|nr:undecaprenyldiphospho-muramoylpentapeptide beta-N-acetylglucosaminyltransferase [Marinomonas profundi]NLQ18484.1 undecaprenyldiphospho-muramoylpentapeptide beta-N-acetylglucosaminyltransferase [Marinomonas profundi]UDV02801.1 undecaprenyldiphospho-muramoylpentapeptide beta-N-acetylglucosaminyltransferase [Marinomonas profundi]
MNEPKTVVIMAGGTGGHIYPALACAQSFKDKGLDVQWLGSRGGMEETLVPKHDIALHSLSIKGVRGKGVLGLLAAPFRILHAVGQALAVLQKVKPSVVLGMGGFVAGPGGVAARLLGIPLVIHEQNAIAGTTNKLLSKFASIRLQAFDGALVSGVSVGNPIRSDILQQRVRESRNSAARPLRLLVVGGSLGAQAINNLVPQVLLNWPFTQRLDVWHQTGIRNFDAVSELYKSAGVDARVEAYLDNMDQAYYWADVVLCRAGAMTVSELAVAGLPSILVPYPHAIDDHQTANARYLEKSGAAYVLPQSQLSCDKIIALLADLMKDEAALLKMGEQAKLVAHPNATQDVVAHCLRLMKS